MKKYFNWTVIKIPLIFLIASILYITFSDMLLLQITDDPILVTRIQTIKGWLYVFGAAVLLYSAVYRQIERKNKIINKITDQERSYKMLSEEYLLINEELQKTSEKYFRIISKLAQPMLLLEGIWTKNSVTDLRIIEINEAANAIVKLNQYDANIRTLNEFVDPKIAPLLFGISQRVLVSGEAAKTEFYSKFFQKFVELHFFRFSTNQIVFLYFDISNLKETEQNLIKAREKAEESDRLKTAFLQNMSHEIRTPMNGILGFSDLLCQDDLSGETRNKYVQVIQGSGHQLMRIIDDVLDLSRIESGVEEVHLSTFHLNPVVDNLELILTESVRKSGKPIQISSSKTLPDGFDIIFSDEYKLKQILLNFISNAEKFTHSGTIELGYYIGETNQLIMFVKDSGIGIGKEQQSIIFERFRQAEENLTRKYGGSGLGLAICKGLTQLLGGSISVESTPGAGSTFSISLPFASGESATDDKEIISTKVNLSTRRVLVVDDLDENLLLINEFLSETGVEVLNARSGTEAYDIFGQNQPIDLVLMDIKLYGEDGITLAKGLMPLSPQTKFIAQTAYISELIKNECIDTGFVDYIVKPIDKNSFMNMIKKHMPIEPKHN
ncbi:MAG: response regulator [Bacteroidales bacterium]|nr:response regulator [Bacteroidales bacterium]